MELPRSGERSPRAVGTAFRANCGCHTLVVLYRDEVFPTCAAHGEVFWRQVPKSRIKPGSPLRDDPPVERTPVPSPAREARTPRPKAARVAPASSRQAAALTAVAKFEQHRRTQLDRVSHDPWAFCVECVQTL